MEVLKNAHEEFVTVVSVGNSNPELENFVTVLSIGNGTDKVATMMEKHRDTDAEIDIDVNDRENKDEVNEADGHPEEEVDVFRLPGERLGFGLKFEGGNKTSEKVRKLFVQSCANESPASRAVCSWGTLGEGDEVLSIDGVPVTQMTRLDCVRRLKESQLVIKLLVRYRGALRPEVVSAERKSLPEKRDNKIPPELPSVPPPVPPRKLRQPRGPADGDANPSPVRKPWDSPQSTTSSSTTDSSFRTQNSSCRECSSKSSSYESCTSSPGSKNSSKNSSPKNPAASSSVNKTHSPDFNKSRIQEPPEASFYLDARSHDGCSTQGSTSDDTGSSMSTVIDRFSSSDRFSTISTASTASATSEQPEKAGQQEANDEDAPMEISAAENIDLVRLLAPFDQLEREFGSNPPTTEYLLSRLTNSEAVTFVEALGDGDGVVERVTAVVAPNTVLIEETITLQPPLSFQDAPLSYGHETRPGLVYTDLAADSTTHFRPIKDDALIVECVNGNVDQVVSEGPPLPARNHVNRVSVTQDFSSVSTDAKNPAPALPPKPMPRKDVRSKRKRPPPPPPPPRREAPSLPSADVDGDQKPAKNNTKNEEPIETSEKGKKAVDNSNDGEERKDEVRAKNHENDILSKKIKGDVISVSIDQGDPILPAVVEIQAEDVPENLLRGDDEKEKTKVKINNEKNLKISGHPETNKMMEIIEMKKAKVLSDRSKINSEKDEICKVVSERETEFLLFNGNEDKNKIDFRTSNPVENEKSLIDNLISEKDEVNKVEKKEQDDATREKDDLLTPKNGSAHLEKTYRSLDEVGGQLKNSGASRILSESSDLPDDDDSSDESDGDSYYWQSNLATIGEEEETNSLEFNSTNCRNADSEEDSIQDAEQDRKSDTTLHHESKTAPPTVDGDEVDFLKRDDENCQRVVKKKSSDKSPVNGRMEHCGGGQRLPPDGDEFPAMYQEFSSAQQQYQFVAGSRVSSTLASNGDLVTGESEVFSTSETFKLLPNEIKNSSNSSNDLNNSNGEEKTTLLQDSRVLSLRSSVTSDGVQLGGATKEPAAICERLPVENKGGKITGSLGSMNDYSYYNGRSGPEKNVVSETKINIKAPKNYSSFTVNEFISDSPPPPLPTSRPPKPDAVLTSGGASRGNQPRKFSLNGDLWRQDDKSEKSVRDKIAMFSSQSSLEAPLFPNIVSTTPTTPTKTCGRKLSKYKSSEDVFADEARLAQKENTSFSERTRSSFDLTTSASFTGSPISDKCDPIPPSLPLTSPPGSPRSKVGSSLLSPSKTTSDILSLQEAKPYQRHSSSLEFKPSVPSAIGSFGSSSNVSLTSEKINTPLKTITGYGGSSNPSSTSLNRATSFSGGSSSLHSRSQSLSDLPPSPQISRTNSLASTFRRPTDDMRRTSLNHLIEQRRKGIWKLRGLVIPEKETLPVTQPIVQDLPEIKSRDSILLQQMPRVNIQDKWGSQSSISSSISTASVPGRITTSFKMPEPQNLPKYSPAFKRKSLAVYGSSSTTPTKNFSPTTSPAHAASEAPKSLESICSPTRSDFSFEYSPANCSPRSGAMLRKARTEYDDSDNDSAVSSSQSSISRGFSPPVSPVPSERSTLSSERSYLSAETISGNFNEGENRPATMDRSQLTTRLFCYHGSLSERSSSSSSSPDPRSPQQSEIYSRNSLQHHGLKRSSSTDTNCSTSSTLTSGSQASAESLSRRVLKPQSVEAINRKNILASARCRSGRDLNGSPLIQRKFSDDEEIPVSKLAQENGNCVNVNRSKKSLSNDLNVKIAYVDVPTNDNQDEGDDVETPKQSPKRTFVTSGNGQRTETLQASNDMKKWVRSEVKTIVNSPIETSLKKPEENKTEIEIQLKTARRRSSLVIDDKTSSTFCEGGQAAPLVNSKPRSRSSLVLEKNFDPQNDLLTVLSTKSRSRSTIHIEERSFGRSQSQMSLEEILDGKSDETSAVTSPGRSWFKEKGFSKIPTPERMKVAERNEEDSICAKDAINQKLNSSRIPTFRSMGRRSASVTDMKKALEKSESQSNHGSQGLCRPAPTISHTRFPSLESSGDIDSERYSAGEQFGSISSLASSTSLISQQELAQLVEEATLEEARGAHDVIVVLYHKENPAGSVGIALAGGVDCETKEITVHRVLAHSIADKDGRVQRGDRILSINGKSTKGLSHRESLAVLKQPRSEVVLVVSRPRDDIGGRLKSRTESVETIVEGSEINSTTTDEQTAWGPPVTLTVFKDGAGLGFSLEGGRDSPLGDRPIIVKKIFAGGAAEKTGALRAGDQMLEVNGVDVTRMSRIEAWSLMKKLHDGEVSLLVRHPATKSSS